jgi:hypothetical protein
MASQFDIERFRELDFEDFRRLAQEPGISRNQRIGFPDSYRDGYADHILDDICNKLPPLKTKNATIIDIGPGCSELSEKLIDLCARQGHRLFLVDSIEMLDLLPNTPFITKVPGKFPNNLAELISLIPDGCDALLCYSVFHYMIQDFGIDTISKSVATLLNESGCALLGDIPNISKRKRFFSTAEGRASHREFTGREELPTELLSENEEGKITDQTLTELITAFHEHGVKAEVTEQSPLLPMANRREDLLISFCGQPQ